MRPSGTTFARVKRHCLSFEGTSERLSHGHPAIFAGKRMFAVCLDNFHDDGRRTVWCAAPEGMQGAMVETDPESYFVPPYVGHRGWLGIRLDRGLEWNEIAGALEDAFAGVTITSRLLRFASGGGGHVSHQRRSQSINI